MLTVEAENKKLYLTRKKALIESPLPLFLSYADARPGRVSHGYIVCIKDFGCIVRFYNNVKGLVPLRELSSEPILTPQEVFYVGQVRTEDLMMCLEIYWHFCLGCLGTFMKKPLTANYLSSVNFFVCFPPIVQVLKAKVLQCDPDKSKMVLSFKAAVEGVTEAPPKPEFDCEVGKVSSRPFLYFYFIFFLYPNL